MSRSGSAEPIVRNEEVQIIPMDNTGYNVSHSRRSSKTAPSVFWQDQAGKQLKWCVSNNLYFMTELAYCTEDEKGTW